MGPAAPPDSPAGGAAGPTRRDAHSPRAPRRRRTDSGSGAGTAEGAGRSRPVTPPRPDRPAGAAPPAPPRPDLGGGGAVDADPPAAPPAAIGFPPVALTPDLHARETAEVVRLGRAPYREVWALQQRLQDRLVAAKRATPPEAVPHAVVVVEHGPVVTVGKSGDLANVVATEAELARRGVEVVRVDRGGDVTLHAPGQLVVYPVLDLDRLRTPEGEPLRDLHRYLRELEEAVVRTCADWGVEAGRVAGRTGVWVGPDGRGPERKVCAMGVRCSRWVTLHGLALNVDPDLGLFDLIVPCGIADRGVTSLAAEDVRTTVADVADRLLGHLGDRLGLDLVERGAAPAGGAAGTV